MTAAALNPALPVFPVIGYMPMPEDFPYKKKTHSKKSILEHGKAKNLPPFPKKK